MIEKVVAHPWPRPEAIDASLPWARVVGELTGFGPSRRANVLPAPYPHLVTRGRGTFRSASVEAAIGPGDMFCIWPGLAHEFFEDPDDPWHFYWMALEGPGACPLAGAMGFSHERLTARPAEADQAIGAFGKLLRYYARREDREPFGALGMLFELVSACRRVGPVAARRDDASRIVEESKALLESLLGTGINVAGLADRLHVSRQRLGGAFREVLGVTPTEHIQAMRIERACRLLRATDLKVAAVASACGYGHEKYFHRHFKERTGQTPATYRGRSARRLAPRPPQAPGP
jgi:AraC-like DNA-binding protein